MEMTSELRTIGVVGDIHAQYRRLARAIELFESAGVDRILAVGDICDGPGDLDACCALLQSRGALAVRGNHERWLFEGILRDLPDAHEPDDLGEAARSFLRDLPVTRDLVTPAGRLLLCHGLGGDDMNGVYPGDFGYGLEVNDVLQGLIREGRYRFVVNGHTHIRMVRSFGGLTIINAGSLTNNRYATISGGRRGDRPGAPGRSFDPGHPCALVVDFVDLEVRPYCYAADDRLLAAEPVSLPPLPT